MTSQVRREYGVIYNLLDRQLKDIGAKIERCDSCGVSGLPKRLVEHLKGRLQYEVVAGLPKGTGLIPTGPGTFEEDRDPELRATTVMYIREYDGKFDHSHKGYLTDETTLMPPIATLPEHFLTGYTA